jgi:hypothetical protein
MRHTEKRALAAFAELIHRHAREWAAAVIASIERDVADRLSVDIGFEVAGVQALEEFVTSDALLDLGTPAGAIDWARAEWCITFVHELERMVRLHKAARGERGEARVRQHLRDLESHR